MSLRLSSARWLSIPHIDDERGSVTVFEASELPFIVQRVFYIHGVPPCQSRGGHAHRYAQQVLVAVSGALTLDVSDGETTETIDLDSPNRAFYLPARTWIRMHGFKPNTVLLVLCDRPYEPQHVLRDWPSYLELVQDPIFVR